MLIHSNIAQSKKAAFIAANVNSLLSVGQDSKTVKGEKLGFLTGVLYLAPHNTVTSAKIKTVCPNAVNAGCHNACLYTAGRGRFNSVKNGRIKRTESFLNDQQTFMVAIWYDIKSMVKRAIRQGLTPCIRLNGTSDLDFMNLTFTNPNGETGSIFDMFPALTFYDYTKNVHLKRRTLPANYSLTFSYSEYQGKYAKAAVDAAGALKTGLAVVFRGALPAFYKGFPVISGDTSDLRFLDSAEFPNVKGKAYIVGLKAKGSAKQDTSGFVIDATL